MRRGSSGSPRTCSTTPRTGATRRRSRSPSSASGSSSSAARPQFTTWLHRLVVNTCRDVAERQRIRRCEPLPDELHAGRWRGSGARSAALAELRAELGSTLAELPPAQARVVVLKDAFDFSFAEISAASGMPVGTAKCYAHRARNGLRARLEPADSAVA